MHRTRMFSSSSMPLSSQLQNNDNVSIEITDDFYVLASKIIGLKRWDNNPLTSGCIIVKDDPTTFYCLTFANYTRLQKELCPYLLKINENLFLNRYFITSIELIPRWWCCGSMQPIIRLDVDWPFNSLYTIIRISQRCIELTMDDYTSLKTKKII